MPLDIMVGLQWGDEGKGKFVDLLAQGNYEAIARYQGGPNAGHMVCVDGKKYIFHMIPSGVLHKNVRNVVGNGTVVDIRALRKEMDDLMNQGVPITKDNFYISEGAHVIMPYHVEAEQSTLSARIDTTKRGIGYAYADKIGRTGIRMTDFCNLRVPEVRDAVLSSMESRCADPRKILEELEKDFELLRPYVTDTSEILNDWLRKGDRILAEGAQGTFLDVDHGTYPYVTSSNSTAGGALTGLGVGPTHVRRVIGVAKAYTTRVGNGPFPTELKDELGERIREKGDEYGASTGRPRRCGWLDLVLLSRAVGINGVGELIVTKLDVLDGLPEIKICTSYDLDWETTINFPLSSEMLERCTPNYRPLAGWEGSIAHLRDYSDTPFTTKAYLAHIENVLQVPIKTVSVGQERSQTIFR